MRCAFAASLVKQYLLHAVRIVQKIHIDAVDIRILVPDRLHLMIQVEDLSILIGQQDRRMGRNEELGALCDKLMDVAKQGHLSLRREGGFRLVEEIQPLIPEPVLDQLEKGLPVGTGVQILAAVGGLYQIAVIADIRRYIVEGFRSQEKPCPGPAESAEGQMAVEL